MGTGPVTRPGPDRGRFFQYQTRPSPEKGCPRPAPLGAGPGRVSRVQLAKAKYLGNIVEKVIRDNPNVPVSTLKNTIMRKCNVDASKWKVIRAKRAALQKILGVDSEQYTRLWDYCETVRARNPGSKILLRKKDDSEPPIFDRMYFSLHAMKAGFLAGCRPIIGLDGCFLKTVYQGQLLVAVGRDANDNMWPIAIAVVPVENREAWTWFLRELLDDLGGVESSHKWTFISDRQKGLIDAVQELAPHSKHRYRLRHMYQNFKMKFKEDVDPKVNPDAANAAEWLRVIPPHHWARSYFITRTKLMITAKEGWDVEDCGSQARKGPVATEATSTIQNMDSNMGTMPEVFSQQPDAPRLSQDDYYINLPTPQTQKKAQL
ncbi:UNVERIFIED_CONTAM: hypothetical protein Slati_4156200 [Sesamum latifolium]|uniref:MULE transposase domain-containing protein n=1 Tax=Sesamum latifolium TaxID=2727402 RepID=A0AAW2T900_9LAMI